MPSQNIKILLSARTWIVVFVFMTLYGAFGLYVYTEKQIDKANEQRLISYQLAEELRQSSDDLTRMVRTYVVTGEPRYKTYFQNILDIRKGLIPRPAAIFTTIGIWLWRAICRHRKRTEKGRRCWS